jgi:putative AlgH/UPF0301 family transcriptional regulator
MYSKRILVSRSVKGPGALPQEKSVIYVFRHTTKGAVGVNLTGSCVGNIQTGQLRDILNAQPGLLDKAKDILLSDTFTMPIFLGGPNKTVGVYFLHGHKEFANITKPDHEPEELLDDEIKQDAIVTDGVYFGTPYTFGRLLEEGHQFSPLMRFFTGQCKWLSGQLELEVQAGYWDVYDPEPCLFFDLDACNKLLGPECSFDFFSVLRPSLN